jgi:tyrosyl-tRNA synthetase
MSKSQDNYIAFNDTPKEMFGKIMSISDSVMWDYYRLLLLKNPGEIAAMQQEHPMTMKKQLALTLTNQIHGAGKGDYELEQFEKVFSRNQRPDDMPVFDWSKLADSDEQILVNILGNTGLLPSKKEARRLVQQGAVKIDDVACTDPNQTITRPTSPIVLQAGKRVFFTVNP